MSSATEVIDALEALRDSLSNFAMRVQNPQSRNILLQRAWLAGNLGERIEDQFGGGEVPDGEQVITLARDARSKAEAADPKEAKAIQSVIAAATKANARASKLVGATSRAARQLGTLSGSLRVASSRTSRTTRPGITSERSAAAGKETSEAPAYVADVAKLFPIEAATLFPLGLTLADGSASIVALVIVIVACFVIALRYFATKEDGEPAWNEIGASLVSFLLWVGATGGFWVEEGGFSAPVNAETGAGLFGFVTIMWVSLAPYLIKEQALKRGAAA
ncbi:hypothetical protein [Erythrobacter sp.]|uniref:hypothetical protein n=1 Tax=Erythrobacter sp. TaxID=1042 RepID=UPI001B2F6A5F|nr:hypothetical protein [Erythrobacter sp.]MBO6527573.1 hypothetical protein [Erythrobacter sp.]MBO6530253.1 hypothetical protein [Erythrobacter sp.]